MEIGVFLPQISLFKCCKTLEDHMWVVAVFLPAQPYWVTIGINGIVCFITMTQWLEVARTRENLALRKF